MKQTKLFLSLLMLFTFSIGNVWGAEVSWTSSDEAITTKDGISITMSKTDKGNYYQIYKNSTMTVSSLSSNITKIVITCTQSGTTQYGPGGIPSGNGYTYSGYDGTWEGDATDKVSLTASNNQVRITKIEVTYSSSTEPFLSVDKTEIDFGIVEQGADIEPQTVAVTMANIETVMAGFETGCTAFSVSPDELSASGDLTITPNTSVAVGTYTNTLTITDADEQEEAVTVSMNVVAPFVGKKLMFDLTKNNLNLPTSLNSTKAGFYTYTLNEEEYVFYATCNPQSSSKNSGGIYFSNSSSKYVIIYPKNYLGLPALAGYKLVKAEVTNSSTCSQSVNVSITTDGTTIVTGGNAQTFSTVSTTYTFSLSGTTANTMYYLTVANNKNCQVTGLTLYYEAVELAKSTITLKTNPEDVGKVTTMVDGIEVGATVQESKTVTLSATPNNETAYRFKDFIVKDADGADVTVTNNSFVMPAKAVTVTANFVPLYAVSVAVYPADETFDGTGSVKINGDTKTIYITEDEVFTIEAIADPANKFEAWDYPSGKIILDNEDAEKTTGFATASGTITAYFTKDNCTPLAAPVLQTPIVTYNEATISWEAVEHATGYILNIKKGETAVVTGEMLDEDVTTYTMKGNLEPSTTYAYSVYATGDGTTYCDFGNHIQNGKFTTAALPKYTITWNVDGIATTDGDPTTEVELGSAITALPTIPTSTKADAVFIGWTKETSITGEPADLFTTAADAPDIAETTIFNAVWARKVISNEYELINRVPKIGEKVVIYHPTSEKIVATATENSITADDVTPNNNKITAESNWIWTIGEGGTFIQNDKYLTGYDNTLGWNENVDNWTIQKAGSTDHYTLTSNIAKYSNKAQSLEYYSSKGFTLYTYASGNNDNFAFDFYVQSAPTYDNYTLNSADIIIVEKPIFKSPDATNIYTTAQHVILECATEGAEIRYTIDNSVPTETSTLYTATGIEITATTTIKAIAVKYGSKSEVVSATYTIVTPYTTIASLQASATETEREVYIQATNWVVNGSYWKGAYVVDEENRGVFIYGSSNLKKGDKVSGLLKAKLVLYNGETQLIGIDKEDFSEQSTTKDFNITALTNYATLNKDNQGQLVQLLDAMYDGTDLLGAEYDSDSEDNRYKYDYATPNTDIYSHKLSVNKHYNYTGIVVYTSDNDGYNNISVAPRSADDIEQLADKQNPDAVWYTDDTKAESLNTAVAHVGDVFSAYFYTNSDGKKIYTSSKESVAKIDETGNITIMSEGTTDISCSVSSTEAWYATTAKFTLTVLAAGVNEFVWVAAEQGFEDAAILGKATKDTDPITITFSKELSKYDPKYFDKNKTARYYVGGTLTITATEEGKIISKIEFTCDTKSNQDANIGSYDTETGIWTGGNKSVTFTGTGATQITLIKVYYYEGIETTLSIDDITMKTTGEVTIVPTTNSPSKTIVYSGYDEDLISITDGKITAKKEGETTVTATIAADGKYASATTTFKVVVANKTTTSLSFAESTYSIGKGRPFTTPVLTTTPANLQGIQYSSSNETVATVDAKTGAVTILEIGQTVITAELVENDDYKGSKAQYTLTVTDPMVDVLTAEWSKVEANSTYKSWKNIVNNSGTLYAGNNYNKDGKAIQMNDDKSSGIVSTESVGFIQSVTIEFSSLTTSNRVIDIYGSNKPYTSADALYSYEEQSTKIGSIAYTTDMADNSVTLDLRQNYKYIGIRPQKGAVMISQITIAWKVDYTRPLTTGNIGTICLPYAVKENEYIGASFYEIAYKELDANGDPYKVFFDEVTELEAGMPYIFVPQEGAKQVAVLYSGDEVTAAGTKNGLVGTFISIDDNEQGNPNNVLEGNYIIYDNQLHKCIEYCGLDPYRAYVDMDQVPDKKNASAPAPGRRRIALGNADNKTTTGVDNMVDGNTLREGIYDVLGRKLAAPQGTGFYIINGKKVMVVR